MDFQEEYSIIGQICRNICKDKDLVDDLIQEVSIIWFQYPEHKKDKVRTNNAFKFWVARTTKNQWSSSSSPFYNKYRKVSRSAQEFQAWHSPEDVEYDSLPDEQYELMMKHIDRLFPSEYNILYSYYFKKMTIMDIVARFDVEKTFVWKTLKRVGKSLKRKVQWDVHGYTEQELLELVVNLVGKKYKMNIDERQIVLDVHNVLFGGRFNNVYDHKAIEQMLAKLVIRLKL